MPPSESTDVNGVALSLVEKGAGRPAVFVHGSLSDYRAWAAQVAALSGSFRTISYSRRCAYPNQRRDYENSTIENNADDLAHLLRAKDAAPAHLVGHSYGAFTALYCAYRNPQLVRSLVLVEPYVPSLLVKDPQNRAEVLSLMLRRPSLAMAARNSINNLHAVLKALDEGLDERALELFFGELQGKPDAYSKFPEQFKSMLLDNAETIREITAKTPQFTAEEARAIKTPALLISGDYTHKVQAAIAEALLKSVANISVARISGSAHFPHIENPEETNSAISGFLSRQDM